MNKDGSRLEASIQGMKAYYPRFSMSGSPIGTGPVGVWKGTVQPIQSRANLEALLDDIYHDRPVEIFPEGRVEHLERCKSAHTDHDWMEAITNPFVEYKLELRYGGDATHPQAFVIDPLLPRAMKHTLGDGSICPYAPWEKVWSWTQDTVVDFMDHVLIWLIKITVWIQARVWLGEERRHEKEYLLATIDPTAQCWCGSGAQYQNCHRSKDRLKLLSSYMAVLAEYDRRNPYFIEVPQVKFLRRSQKAASAST